MSKFGCRAYFGSLVRSDIVADCYLDVLAKSNNALTLFLLSSCLRAQLAGAHSLPLAHS